jgi:hypothetical protein
MDVIEAVDRLRQAHADAGLGQLVTPGPQIETVLGELSQAIAPWRLPRDLVTFWRSVDPDSLALAPCPRPAGPGLALRLWRGQLSPDWGLASYFPWCYESHDYLLVELDEPSHPRGQCFSWAGGSVPVVHAFTSVAAYLDLFATMLELREFVHHTELGIIEFDPGRRWPDAQAVRLAATRVTPDGPFSSQPTTVADLLGRSARGETPNGTIRARVVALAGCASGQRIEVTDGTGRLDVWCPATLCGSGPMIDRLFDFQVAVRPGDQCLSDPSAVLSQVERATREGDLRAAVTLAAPLYDELFGTPAKAEATALRPAD